MYFQIYRYIYISFKHMLTFSLFRLFAIQFAFRKSKLICAAVLDYVGQC